MKNLIQNARWSPNAEGNRPNCFSGKLATYDELCIDEYRTCSITQTEGQKGYDQYDPAICVRGERCIQWGYKIRTVDADCIILQALFMNGAGEVIDRQRLDITEHVGCDFSRHMARFPVPRNAACVRLSLQFRGKVTACTFYSPAAYFC